MAKTSVRVELMEVLESAAQECPCFLHEQRSVREFSGLYEESVVMLETTEPFVALVGLCNRKSQHGPVDFAVCACSVVAQAARL